MGKKGKKGKAKGFKDKSRNLNAALFGRGSSDNDKRIISAQKSDFTAAQARRAIAKNTTVVTSLLQVADLEGIVRIFRNLVTKKNGQAGATAFASLIICAEFPRLCYKSQRTLDRLGGASEKTFEEAKKSKQLLETNAGELHNPAGLQAHVTEQANPETKGFNEDSTKEDKRWNNEDLVNIPFQEAQVAYLEAKEGLTCT